MPNAEIYRTQSGYIVKVSANHFYELIRTDRGFLTKNIGYVSIPDFKGIKTKGIPNEIKRIFFNLQKK
jgi:hypothetical protein